MQEFVAPISTQYELQCWGSQGAAGWGGTTGLGGYAEGKMTINVGNSIYICVGDNRGYNNKLSFTSNGPLGGGSTSITTSNRGELTAFKDHKSEVILVAGGGGGIEREGRGGAGGGEKGIDGVYTGAYHAYGKGGTQTAGGQQNIGVYAGDILHNPDFGVGGTASMLDSGHQDNGPQGGGGWYGGGGTSYAGAAGGGSGHVNTSLLATGAQTIAGDKSFPSIDGKNETGHSGYGNCVITWKYE